MPDRWVIDLVGALEAWEEAGHDPGVRCRNIQGCQAQSSEASRSFCLVEALQLVPDEVRQQAAAIRAYVAEAAPATTPKPLCPSRPYRPGVNQCPNCNVGGCQGCDGNGWPATPTDTPPNSQD